MVTSNILGLLISGRGGLKQPVSGAMVWEETPVVQLQQGYHPIIRFGSWQITRFNASTTYMFATPDFVQQGQFEVHDGHYSFRAVMANELENADIARLISGMNPEAGHKLAESYAKSMSNFEGDYKESDKTLTFTYTVEGRQQSFELHATTEGDDQLVSMLSDSERALAGLWHAPEPFPDKLDARTRYKIGDLEGLERFAKEAGASESAQFAILDLRVDRSFRNHSKIGRWSRSGSTLSLMLEGKQTDLTISADGSKLQSHGKTVYERN
jgi:hypothetical protein